MNSVRIFPKEQTETRLIWWVTKAASKEAARYHLQGVHVEDDMAVATDGHRLHAVRLPEGTLEDGSWEILKSTKTNVVLRKADFEFPDWKSVVPSGEAVVEMSITLTERLPERPFARVLKCLPEGQYFNYHYFKDACDNATLTVSIFEPGQAIKFHSNTEDGKLAQLILIMPIRE